MNSQALRITRLTERDFMRIHSLDIQPGNKTLIVLKGPNEQGKTSAIRAIISALTGKRADPDMPIRQGAEKTLVELTLADSIRERYRVTVSWTPSGRYLNVYELTEDGQHKLSAGQGILESLVGDMSFSPTKFNKADNKTKLKMLLAAIGKTGEWESNRGLYRTLFDDRSEGNREVKRLTTEAASVPDPSPEATLKIKGTVDLEAQLDKAQKVTRFIEQLNQYDNETSGFNRKREELRVELEALDRLLILRDEKSAASHAKLDEQTLVTTGDVMASIARINDHNANVEKQVHARKLTLDLIDARATVKRQETAMAVHDRALIDMVSSSNLAQRIPSLTINSDGEIYHNDLPLTQASGMRQLEIACLIGMLGCKALRVMLIDEGDKLDEDSIARMTEIAVKHDFQIWMTAIYATKGDPREHIVRLLDGMEVGAKVLPSPNIVEADKGVADMYGDGKLLDGIETNAMKEATDARPPPAATTDDDFDL